MREQRNTAARRKGSSIVGSMGRLDNPPFRTGARTISGLYDAIARSDLPKASAVRATVAAARVALAAAERAGATDLIPGYDEVVAALDAVEERPDADRVRNEDLERMYATEAAFKSTHRVTKSFEHLYPNLNPRDLVPRVTRPHALAIAANSLVWSTNALERAAWMIREEYRDQWARECRFAADQSATVLLACGEAQPGGAATSAATSADAIVMSTVLSSLRSPKVAPEGPKGNLFVTLRPAPLVALELAHLARKPPEDLHLTLAFYKKLSALPPDAAARAITAARRVVEVPREAWGWTGDVRVFPAVDGVETVCLSLDGPSIVSLREAFVYQANAEGLSLDTSFGFTPHITLGTRRVGEPWAPEAPPRRRLDFDRIWVCAGRAMTPIALVARREERRTR